MSPRNVMALKPRQVLELQQVDRVGSARSFGEKQHDFARHAGEHQLLESHQCDPPEPPHQIPSYGKCVAHMKEFCGEDECEPSILVEKARCVNDECRPGTGQTVKPYPRREGRSLGFRAGGSGERLITDVRWVPDDRIDHRLRCDVEEISGLDLRGHGGLSNHAAGGLAGSGVQFIAQKNGIIGRTGVAPECLKAFPGYPKKRRLSTRRLQQRIVRSPDGPLGEVRRELRRRVEGPPRLRRVNRSHRSFPELHDRKSSTPAQTGGWPQRAGFGAPGRPEGQQPEGQ